MKSKRKIKEIG